MFGPIRNLLLKNPQNLDKIPNKMLTEDDILFAYYKGYVVNKKTSLYVMEYIIFKFGNKFKGKMPCSLFVQLIKEDSSLLSTLSIENVDTDSMNDNDIDIFIESIKNFYNVKKFIDNKIVYRYVYYNPDELGTFLSSKYIDDYQKLYDLIKDKIDEEIFNCMGYGVDKEGLNKLLVLMVNDKPEILLNYYVFSKFYYNQNTYIELLIDNVKKGKIELNDDDIEMINLFNNSLLINFIIDYNFNLFTKLDFNRMDKKIIEDNLDKIEANDVTILFNKKIYDTVSKTEHYISIIKNAIKNKQINFDYALEHDLLKYQVIIEEIIKADMSCIDKISSINSIELFDCIAETILDNPDEYSKYLPSLLEKCVDMPVSIYAKGILNLLIDKKIVIKNTKLSFITQDADYMFTLFMENPDIINTFTNFFDSYTYQTIFSQLQIEQIADKIREKKVYVSKYHNFLAIDKHYKIFEEVLKINPFLVDDITYQRLDSNLDYYYDFLKQYGYKLSKYTPSYIIDKIDFKTLCSEIERDKNILYNPCIYSILEKMTTEDEIYFCNVVLSKGFHLQNNSSDNLFYPLLVIDALKNKTLQLNKNIVLKIKKTNLYEKLLVYIKNNCINIDEYFSSILNSNAKKDKLIEKIDFEQNRVYNISYSENDYKKIFIEYLKNRDEYVKYYDAQHSLITGNPYIVLYELKNGIDAINLDVLKYNQKFINEFLELCREEKIKILGTYYNFIFENDELLGKQLLTNNLNTIYDMPCNIDPHKNKFYASLLMNGMIDITRINNLETISCIIDFCIEKNIQNTLTILDKYVISNKKLDAKYINYLADSILNGSTDFSRLESASSVYYTLNERNVDFLVLFTQYPKNMQIIEDEYYICKNLLQNESIKNLYEDAINKGIITQRLTVREKIEKDVKILLDNKRFIANFNKEESELFHKKLLLEYKNNNIDITKVNNFTYLVCNSYYEEKSGLSSLKHYELDEDLTEEILNEASFDICIKIIKSSNVYEYDNLINIIKEKFNKLTDEEKDEYMLDILIYLRGNRKYLEFYTLEQIYEKNYTSNFISDEEFLSIWSVTKDIDKGIKRYSETKDNKLLQELLNIDVKYIYSLPCDEQFCYEFYKQHSDELNIFSSYILLFNEQIVNEYLYEGSDKWNDFVLNNESIYLFNTLPDNEFKTSLVLTSLKNDINSISYIIRKGYFKPEIIDYIKNTNIVLSKENIDEIQKLVDNRYIERKNNQKLFADTECLFKKIENNEKDFENQKISYALDLLYLSLKNNAKATIENSNNYFIFKSLNTGEYEKLIEYLINDNYIINENTKEPFNSNSRLIIESIKKVPESIKYATIKDFLTDNEIALIKNIIYENELYYPESAPYFMLSETDYVLNCIKKDIYNLDKIKMFNIDTFGKVEIINYVKEKLLSGEYKLSVNSPDFLYIDEDILSLAFVQIPDYIKNIYDSVINISDYEMFMQKGIDYDNENNPYIIINNILNNLSLIDDYNYPKDIIYPDNLIDTLVDRLIENRYVPSEKTPLFLYNSDKFIIYCLTNNLYIQDELKNNFVNFEKMYEVKEKSLFISLINNGYGQRYFKYVNTYGVEQTVEYATKYGVLLEQINPSETKCEDIDLYISNAMKDIKKNDKLAPEYVQRAKYDVLSMIDNTEFLSTILSYNLVMCDENEKNIIFEKIYNNYSILATINLNNIINTFDLTEVEKKYFEFLYNNYYFEVLDEIITSREEISKYFDKDGPKKELYDYALFSDSFKLFDTDNYKTICNYSKDVETFIEYRRKYYNLSKIVNSLSDVNDYFKDGKPTRALYDKALFEDVAFSDSLFKLFDTDDYKAICNYPKEVEVYIEFRKKYNLSFITCLSDINNYFKDGKPAKALYDKALLRYDLFKLFATDDYKSVCNYSIAIEKYIEFRKIVGFNNSFSISAPKDITEYFSEDIGKPTKKILNIILKDERLFTDIIVNDIYNWKQACSQEELESMSGFVKFAKIKNYRCIMDLMDNDIDKIFVYFKNNEPTKEFLDVAVIKFEFISIIVKDYFYLLEKYYNEEQLKGIISYEKAHVKYKMNSFGIIENIDDLFEFFDENGLTSAGIEKIIEKDLYKNFDKEFFKEHYEKNYNITSLNTLLALLDNNYHYFIKFVKDTTDLSIPLKEEDNQIINDKYCLNVIGRYDFIDIIKYIYYSDTESSKEISNIIKKDKLLELFKIYKILRSDFNINDFKKVVLNFNSNEALLDNIYLQNDLTADEKAKLYMMMINGDKSAAGVINTREELKNYSEIIYEQNEKNIKSLNIVYIKKLIFKMLFNIDYMQLQIILRKYEDGNCIENLINQVEDEELKNIVKEYDSILKLIVNINNSSDLESLKTLTHAINKNYKENLDDLSKIWEYFSKLDDNLMYILGEEVNEKITDFNELLETDTADIPSIDDEPAYMVSTLKLKDNFEYDNYTIDSGTEVKMIELNGLPFVTFGHVLNAYETSYHGQLLDFNHPRVIGRTHLCLSAIDDNFHGLARNKSDLEKRGPDIDYVQLLFSDVPSEKLRIASKEDAVSRTEENEMEIKANRTYGQYNPIRETICETYHEEYEKKGKLKYGHNEYTYFRNGIMPSAVLIRGDEPTESEIQAAAYLSKICGKDIPIVKINKSKYPINSTEEMRKKDEELQKTFYKEMYEKRRSYRRKIDIEKLKNIKNIISKYSFDSVISEEISKKVI